MTVPQYRVQNFGRHHIFETTHVRRAIQTSVVPSTSDDDRAGRERRFLTPFRHSRSTSAFARETLFSINSAGNSVEPLRCLRDEVGRSAHDFKLGHGRDGEFLRFVGQDRPEPFFGFVKRPSLAFCIVSDLIDVDFADAKITALRM